MSDWTSNRQNKDKVQLSNRILQNDIVHSVSMREIVSIQYYRVYRKSLLKKELILTAN